MRIIEASAALAEWIELRREDKRLYRQLMNRAAAYLPMPTRTSEAKVSAFATLADSEMATRLVQAINPEQLDRVRADANNLWPDAEQALAHLQQLDFDFLGIEEPLRAGDLAGMACIGRALDTALILDESVLRSRQLAALPDASVTWIVNLRISKMGGVLRSLALVDELRRMGLHLIIGAHVGETSLLTRAALTVANTARDILVAQEGAFGTHLLERDIVDAPIMFGAGGQLDGDALPRTAGWGLNL